MKAKSPQLTVKLTDAVRAKLDKIVTKMTPRGCKRNTSLAVRTIIVEYEL